MSNILPTSGKQLLTNAFSKGAYRAILLGGFGSIIQPRAADARVYFDTDVYGDKELKIATVNKIKQKLRNAILEDPSVAPQLLQLSINDALGFNALTQEGGPDGSIQFEMAESGPNAGLEKAVGVLMKIKKELARTNTAGFGDLCAFGGAEALETAGCSRMIVQVGRFDAKAANDVSGAIDWRAPTSSSVTQAFETAGLEPRDIAVLLGSIGELKRVVTETLIEKSKKTNEEDEDDAEFEEQPFVPTTFGARDNMYGSKLGKGDFGVAYFKSILSGKKDELSSILLDDSKVKVFVQKYATNEAAFLKDVPEVYVKLNLLGQASTNRNA
jgi:hypothetical protein